MRQHGTVLYEKIDDVLHLEGGTVVLAHAQEFLVQRAVLVAYNNNRWY